MSKRKTTDLNLVRRRLAFRIAEAVRDYLRPHDEGYDLDEATDLIAILIPSTRAEAEADAEELARQCGDHRPGPQKPSMFARLRELLQLEAGVSIAGTLDSAVNEILRLRAIVDKLNETADHVKVVPGMKVYRADPTGYIQGYDVGTNRATDDSSVPCLTHLIYSQCYSTREVAEAAQR